MASDKPTRPPHTMQATIERVDNGVTLIVRQRASAGDSIVLKKVYTEPGPMVDDLLSALDFKIEG